MKNIFSYNRYHTTHERIYEINVKIIKNNSEKYISVMIV